MHPQRTFKYAMNERTCCYVLLSLPVRKKTVQLGRSISLSRLKRRGHQDSVVYKRSKFHHRNQKKSHNACTVSANNDIVSWTNRSTFRSFVTSHCNSIPRWTKRLQFSSCSYANDGTFHYLLHIHMTRRLSTSRTGFVFANAEIDPWVYNRQFRFLPNVSLSPRWADRFLRGTHGT